MPFLWLEEAHHTEAWPLLDFGTETNPVQAALLHTGDVLFFAGSCNDPDRQQAHQFRTRVWHYPRPGLDAPHTPIDLFCVGQAFAGSAPVTKASGRSIRITHRHVKNNRLAAAGFVWAFIATATPQPCATSTTACSASSTTACKRAKPTTRSRHTDPRQRTSHEPPLDS